MPTPPDSFFAQPIVPLARALIGATLLVDGVGGIIVETEAYAPDDPASHSFNGQTPRNRAMFGAPGHAYVYRSYGLHWCLNIVGGEVPGAAVLIRAIEPTAGLEAMIARRRGLSDPRRLCAGPGCLTQAMGVTVALDGKPIAAPPFALTLPDAPPDILAGPRIGIGKAVEQPWRFGLAGSRFLSKPLRA